MIEIINPNLYAEENIYELRKKEFERLPTLVRDIAQIVTFPECGGFNIKELEIRDTITQKGELAPTKKGEIIFVVEDDKGKEIDLSMYYPTLDNNCIIINGLQKLPLWQCIDYPVLIKDDIKIRTNIATICIKFSKKSDFDIVQLQFAGANVPLAAIFLAMNNNLKELEELVSQHPKNSKHEIFLNELSQYLEASKEFTEEECIRDVGHHVSRGGDYLAAGKNFLFRLWLLLKVDIFTARILGTDSVLEAICQSLEMTPLNERDFAFKRIRLIEYLLNPFIKQIYEFCISNFDKEKLEFNPNKQQILTSCNSEIVQYNFSCNPIEELSKLSRMSLLGIGGFKRDSVPVSLRDIDDSMFGRICAIDTPDRENCGIVTSLMPKVKLNEHLGFDETIDTSQTVSTTISLIPFLEKDDPTRLQMAASQMRQSIALEKFEHPMVRSGCENLFVDYTQFIKKAKEDGVVAKITENFILVIYDSGQPELIDISLRPIYDINFDMYNIKVEENDKIKKGDIIVEGFFIQDGSIVFGNNLLTAIMPYHGYNYEDGIVISDRLVEENIMTSLHYVDLSFHLPESKILLDLKLDPDIYIPLPLTMYEYTEKIKIYEKNLQEARNEEEIIKINKKIKKLEELKSKVYGPNVPYARIQDEKIENFFRNELELFSPNNTKIADVQIYANSWSKTFPQFRHWIEQKIETQINRGRKFISELSEVLDSRTTKELVRKHRLDRFEAKKFKIKEEQFDGVYFKISGVFKRPIRVGDKLGNRHGNKGVIAKIIPREKMPIVEDYNKPVDIILNPLGIISRMNLGQLNELHLSTTVSKIRKISLKMLEEKCSQSEIKNFLRQYIEIIDNTENKWYSQEFSRKLEEIEITKTFLENFTVIQPPFESLTFSQLEKAMEFAGETFEKKIYDPILKIENEVAVGYLYIYRLMHIAEDKLSSRSTGNYTKRTMQPLRGRKNKGGQRLGEMEVACLIGHDAIANLQECLTLKSDDMIQKNMWLKNIIHASSEDIEDSKVESIRLLDCYLKVLGIEEWA